MSDELDRVGQRALVDPKTNKPRGYENFEAEDLILPRIAIGQSMSKPVQNGEVKLGDLYNTLTLESFSKDNQPYLEFVVIHYGKARRLWDKDNKDNSLCMSLDGRVSQAGDTCATQCPHLRFDVAKEPGTNPQATAFEWSQDNKDNRLSPACTLYNNYLSIPAPFDTAQFPLAISMGRTSAKVAKTFNSLIMSSGLDIFAKVYTLGTEKKENKKGTYFVYKFKPLRLVNATEHANAEALRVKLMGTNYKVHEEGQNEDGTEDNIPF